MTETIVCCFCGKNIDAHNAIILEVHSSVEPEEIQGLYCHKKCFVNKIDKEIPLHPFLVED